jgi:hypothetical protein
MATSRRKFIKVGTLGALFAGIPLRAAATEIFERPASVPGSKHQSDVLTMQAFASHINSEFRLNHGNAKTTSLKLIEVNDLRSITPGNTSKECFSAVFVGLQKTTLRQDTYVIEHEALGKFSLLLVPIGMGKKEKQYEAIFNRLR